MMCNDVYENYACTQHGDAEIHAMPDDTIDGGNRTNALKSQLNAAVTKAEVEQDKVRSLVCALVDQMKAEGAEPQKVVVAIKSAILGDTTVKAAPDSTHLKETEKMLQRALSWCLERYYGDAG
jgi:predicted RNase H-like nuclease